MLRSFLLRKQKESRATKQRASVARAVDAATEMLESRVLMAVTLPAGFSQTLVASGFGEPTDVVPGPAGQLYITEKNGALRVFDHGILQPTPFVTVPVDIYRDRGLDAVALDPNFSTNGFIYLYYTNADPSNPNTAPNGAVNRLSRFTANPANPDVALPGSEVVLIDNIPSNTGYHIGGLLAFGTDGKIYLGTGDGGVPFNSQTSGVPSFAQDLTSLGGKILRINPDGTIPSDNPFVSISGDRPEIWAYGMRNPFTGAVDPVTGKLFVDDVGQASWEEVDAITAGGNYGWPNAEGNSTNPAYINPLYTYAHDVTKLYSAAVTGGTFYRGSTFPSSYSGKFFFSDYIQGWIDTLDPVTGAPTPFATGTNGPIRIESASDGGIYYLSHNDLAVYKISYTGNAARPPTAVMSVSGTNGLAPLSVSFDGSASSDPDGHPLNYTWNFGDGTTGTGVTTRHQYTTNGKYTATLTVDDGQGLSNQTTSPVITVGAAGPVPVISTPVTNTLYTAGDTINYAGTATDLQDGTLPNSAYSWSVVFHHELHTHTFMPNIPGVTSGSFVIPTDGETDPVQWYRITLTVTDSLGLVGSTYADVIPRKINLTLASNVPGASLTLDGQPVVSPITNLAVAGLVRGLGAPAQQTVNEINYGFSSWSNGGSENQTITTPTIDTTYTANFVNLNLDLPYGGTPAAVPGIIQAANFDTGGEGVAYHSAISTNNGTANYRPAAGISLDNSGDAGSTYNIGWLYAGEWLNYTVNVATAGVYQLQARAAASGNGGTFHLNVDGLAVTGPITVPDTGGWQTYLPISVPTVTLPAGQHVIRLVADTGGAQGFVGNISSLTFSAAYVNPLPTAPGILQAENYDLGGEGVAYHSLDATNLGGAYRNDGVSIEATGDTGGGYNVGYMRTGEWLDYTFNVTSSASYIISARVAALTAGGMFHVTVDGLPIGASTAFRNTGAWQTYQSVPLPAVNLAASVHVLRFTVDAVGSTGFAGNLNYLQIDPAVVPPTAPTGLKAVLAKSNLPINLSWTNTGSNAIGTKIERKIGPNGTYVQIAMVGTGVAVYTDSTGASSTQYYYRVRSTNAGGDSPYSTEATATTGINPSQTPYLSRPAVVPGTIQAENFDNGGQGIAYSDTDSINQGGQYRNTGVDIEKSGDTGGGFDVGYTAAGEWLDYTVKVGATGWYAVDTRVASSGAGGTFHIEFDGVDQTGPLTVPNTGGWQTYQTITKAGFYLLAGTHVMRLAMDAAGPGGPVGNFNWMRVYYSPLPVVIKVKAAAQIAAAPVIAPSVTSFTLINTDTNQPIATFDPLVSGTTLNLATLPTRNLSIRANPGSGVGSVRFGYDTNANWRVESVLPYSFAGDNNGIYHAWTPTVGSHTVSATPYSSSGAGGTSGPALSISFTVIDAAQGGPSVSIAATVPNADEQSAAPGTFTITRTGATTQALNVGLTIGGTAVNGTDYNALGTTVVIPAGATSATLTLQPISDMVVDGTKTAVISLAANSAYNITSGSATVSITDGGTVTGSTPFTGTPISLPGTIEAENFDNGGEGVAYHDSTPGNQGGSYRNTDVDIEPSSDANGGYNIGHIVAGEWLQYTVNITTAGNYDLSARMASAVSGGMFRLLLDGADLTGAMAMPNTGGWQTWKTVTKTGVALPAGIHVLRLAFEGPTGFEYGNVNWLSVAPTGSIIPTPPFAWNSIADSPILRGEAQSAVVNGKLYAFGGFTNSLFQATARSDAYDPSTNTWARLPDMPEILTHAATVVDGSTVWVIGGFIGNHPGPQTNHVWKYDTVTQNWSAGPALPFAVGAGAAAMVNRQIHYFGGLLRDASGNPTANTNEHWVLDLNGGTSWSTAANLPRARNHLAGAALNGKIYAIGGQNLEDENSGNSAAVDVYDPATNTWTTGPDLPVARGHINPSTFVVNGRIIVVGGTKNGNIPMTDVTEYDPVLNGWIALPSLPTGLKSPVAGFINGTLYASGGDTPNPSGHGWSAVLTNVWETDAALPVSIGEIAGGVIGGTMYIVGEGSSATLSYTLSTGSWSSASALAVRPYVGNHHGAEVYNGKLYLIGGLGGGSEGKVQIYDPVGNSWSLGASMPFAAGSVATALIGGKIYAAGGIIGSASTTQAAVYDPVGNTWSMIASMPLGVNHAASSTDGKKLYIFGGRDGGNVPSNGFTAVQIYDPATNTWTSSTQPGSTIAPLPQARGGMGKAVYLNGEFYVIGGETLTGAGATSNLVYNRVDIYNPTTNTWRLGTPMLTARHGIFPLLVAGRIYIAGGGVHNGNSNSVLLEVYNAG